MENMRMDFGVPVFIIFAFIAGALFWLKAGDKVKKKIEKWQRD